MEVQEHGVRGQTCISHPPEPLVPLVTIRGNAHQVGHAPRPLGWPGGSLVWSWPLEGPAYEILLFTVPQVPNLLGHLVISSNSDEGILVPSPLHDDYSPEKGQCYVFRNPITHTTPAIEYSLMRVHHHYACAIIYITSSLLSTLQSAFPF